MKVLSHIEALDQERNDPQESEEVVTNDSIFKGGVILKGPMQKTSWNNSNMVLLRAGSDRLQKKIIIIKSINYILINNHL